MRWLVAVIFIVVFTVAGYGWITTLGPWLNKHEVQNRGCGQC